MKPKSRFITATLLLIVSFQGARAECMMDPSPPCRAFWNAEVVFIGTATEVSYSATYQKGEGSEKWNYRDRITRFAVEESFRGKIGKQVDVIATETVQTAITLPDGSSGFKVMGESDCEYKFKQSERYVVYAQLRKTNDGTLAVNYNRTRPLAQADEDLQFIRGLKDAMAGGRLFGSVKRLEQEPWQRNSARPSPVQNVSIVIEGEKQKRETLTDVEGNYSFVRLPPGQYEVSATLPAHLTSPPAQKTRIVERGCAEINFYTQTDGRISGTVFDSQGQPFPKMRLDLALADQDESDPNPQVLWAYADEAGRYEFRAVPAGRYHLGVRLNSNREENFPFARIYYPGVSQPAAATVMTLAEGQRIEKVDFVLPAPLQPRKIEGVVVSVEGRPLPGARVSMMITQYPFSFAWGGSGVTDDAGRFSLNAFEGLSYWINAIINLPQGQMHAEPIDLPANGDVREIKLVVSSPSGKCERCLHRYWPKRKS